MLIKLVLALTLLTNIKTYNMPSRLSPGQRKPKTKKFTVKLREDELSHPDIKAVSGYSKPIKQGKFLDGSKNTKFKFEVPKAEFKSNKTYKDLRGKGRFQKGINALGFVSSSLLGYGGYKTFTQ